MGNAALQQSYTDYNMLHPQLDVASIRYSAPARPCNGPNPCGRPQCKRPRAN